jgi:hypothetical protein
MVMFIRAPAECKLLLSSGMGKSYRRGVKQEMQEKDVRYGPEDKPWRDTVPDSAIADPKPMVSAPNKDPRVLYRKVRNIKYSNFQLPPEGLTLDQRRAALGQLHDYMSVQKKHFLGYQANQFLEYEENLKQYLDYHVNNIGDPFQGGNFTLNSKWMERAVLDYYASLWNARWPHNPKKDEDSYWGYVLSMGSTEGNLYGLWNARDYLEGKVLLYDPEVEEEAKKASMDGQPRPVAPSSTYRQYNVEGRSLRLLGTGATTMKDAVKCADRCLALKGWLRPLLGNGIPTCCASSKRRPQ